ncbi:MAG: hypothetical protein Q8P23_01725 [bacterium]|nr:hypothetical protein [bacterium]
MLNSDKLSSDKKFFEILQRNGVPTVLKTMTVAMRRDTWNGKETMTFCGVGKPVSADVLRAINEEVIPLLELERNGIYKYEIIVSNEILELGEPARRQASWNACMSNLDS